MNTPLVVWVQSGMFYGPISMFINSKNLDNDGGTFVSFGDGEDWGISSGDLAGPLEARVSPWHLSFFSTMS